MSIDKAIGEAVRNIGDEVGSGTTVALLSADSESESAIEKLALALKDEGKVSVVDNQAVARIRAEMSDQDAQAIGRALGARYIVWGSLVKTKDHYRFEVSTVKVEDLVGNTPPWLNDVPPGDVFWGIGNAKQSNDNLSLTTAEAQARVSIAHQLDTIVRNTFTRYNESTGSKILKMRLDGSRVIKRWRSPDGTWWCLIEYPRADAEKSLAQEILSN